MDVRNCRNCGRIFNYVVGPMICPACKEEAEKKFQEVKDFIRDNKKAGIGEICENCDVTEKQIKQWVREERLTFGDESPIGIDCEGCGVMIKSGRYCDKCKNDLARGLMSAASSTKKDDDESIHSTQRGAGPKMRFLE